MSVSLIGWIVAGVSVIFVFVYEYRQRKTGKDFFNKTGKTWERASDLRSMQG